MFHDLHETFLSPSDGPDDVSYFQDEADAIVAAARDLWKPVFVHAYDDESVRRAAIAGVRSVEHGSLATVNTLEILADKDIYLVPTQTAVVAWARHAFDDNYNTNELRGCGIAAVECRKYCCR
jgi:imidazolonepropionase-like amidohydrolase